MKRTIALTLTLLLTAPAVQATYELGDVVQDFTLLTPGGQPVSLSDFSEQVVLINFFATWCPPCNEEVPMLQDLYQTHRDLGFAVLGIDLLEDPQVVATWAESFGLTYPLVMATDWGLFQLFPQAGGFPYNAVVDQEGVLRYAGYGINMDEITDLVQELLLDPVPTSSSSFSAVKALYR